jgi:hypothetical protein
VKFEVTYYGQFVCSPEFDGEVYDDAEEIEKGFDGTMRELAALNVEDASVSGSIASGDIEISGVFEGDTHADAVSTADVAFRSAFHAAGVFTREWETDNHRLWLRIEKIEAGDLVDAP